MNTLLLAVRFLLILVVPFLMAIAPLILFLALSHHQSIKQSVGLVALSTVAASLTGLITPPLAFWVCAASMTIGVADGGPRCITGVAFFLVVGYVFTAVTVVIGSVFTIKLLISQRRTLGY